MLAFSNRITYIHLTRGILCFHVMSACSYLQSVLQPAGFTITKSAA